MVTKKPLTLDSAEATIEAFGGVRPMATALGVPASTVQGWKERGNIPQNRHQEIITAHAQLGTESNIPVDHAIDAAADMVDTQPFQADRQTRNYQPPRSSGAGQPSGTPPLALATLSYP